MDMGTFKKMILLSLRLFKQGVEIYLLNSEKLWGQEKKKTMETARIATDSSVVKMMTDSGSLMSQTCHIVLELDHLFQLLCLVEKEISLSSTFSTPFLKN